MPIQVPTTAALGQANHPLAVALALLRADAPEQTHDPQAWPRWAVLLPHVLATTTHLDGSLGSPAPASVADAAWLLDRAGSYLRVHARLADARSLLETALAIDEAACEPGHPDVVGALNNLAQILWDLGEFAEARELQARALAIDEAAYGAGHPAVTRDVSNLAGILRDLGRPVRRGGWRNGLPLLTRARGRAGPGRVAGRGRRDGG